MNKKGFTLVELMAVILILSIIMTMVLINANYFSNQRKQRDYENIVTIIEENTKVLVTTDYTVSNQVDDKLGTLSASTGTASCKISYGVLVDNGLMDSDTKNPVTNKVINSSSYVKVTIDSSNELKYKFIYVDENNPSPENLQNCF